MGSLTISTAQGTPAFSGSKTFTISDANLTIFYNWCMVTYGQPTQAAGLLAWAEDMVQTTVGRIAQVQAQAAIVPIPIT